MGSESPSSAPPQSPLRWGQLTGCVRDYLKSGPVPSEYGYPGDLEELVRKRRGAVLARHTILKSDHFDHRKDQRDK